MKFCTWKCCCCSCCCCSSRSSLAQASSSALRLTLLLCDVRLRLRCVTRGIETVSGCASSEGRITSSIPSSMTFVSEAQPTSCHIDVDEREEVRVEVEAPSKIQLGREVRFEPEPDTRDCRALLGTVTSCAVAIWNVQKCKKLSTVNPQYRTFTNPKQCLMWSFL